MAIDKFQYLACPLDGLVLKQLDNTLHCSQGHHYDIARQGYVNLLPVQLKKSRQPGDSKEMIAARSRFLNDGFYAPVVSRLMELSFAHLSAESAVSCLDAGCGEGYYLSCFADQVEQKNSGRVQLMGLDISKAAIVAATKRNPAITWVVGNNQHAPVKKSSIDMCWSVFGFNHLRGFRHVLRKGGKLITFEAGVNHLIEIRKIIYPEIKKTRSAALNEIDAYPFREIGQSRLSYQTQALSTRQLDDLLLMTPHLFRASREGKQAMRNMDSMILTVDVLGRVFEAL